MLSFIVVFLIRLSYIPSPFEDFEVIVALEALLLIVLLVIGVLTTVERS